jgi:hypothetical protein
MFVDALEVARDTLLEERFGLELPYVWSIFDRNRLPGLPGETEWIVLG